MIKLRKAIDYKVTLSFIVKSEVMDMRTKEIERELGLTKHTIRYYEKEGLLKPKKDENGYRDYSEEDLQTLHLIKFLRNLNISMDDVKGIINGNISFQECLMLNKDYIKDEIDKLQELHKTVKSYQEKDIPLIPALQNVEIEEYTKSLGFHKSTKTISLGIKLTKENAKKQWLSSLLVSLFFGFTFGGMLTIGFGNKGLLSYLFVLIFSILLQQIFIGMNFKSSLFWVKDIIDHSQNQSIEFLHDRIRYYKFNGFKDNIQYFYSVLFDKNHKYIKEVLYCDIKSVTVLLKHRYMKIESPLAIDNYVLDFYFKFNNNETFYFYWPLTLENDLRYIAIILEEMVDHIIDEEHVLEIIKEGKNINEYIRENKS